MKTRVKLERVSIYDQFGFGGFGCDNEDRVGLIRSGAKAGPQPTEFTRKRALAQAMRDASAVLSNTPAIAKSSYVDPRLVDKFTEGLTIDPTRLASAESPAPGKPPAARAAAATSIRRNDRPNVAPICPPLQVASWPLGTRSRTDAHGRDGRS